VAREEIELTAYQIYVERGGAQSVVGLKKPFPEFWNRLGDAK
jgi:hypothetical protein